MKPEDEQAFLQILENEPDNEEARRAYWDWLEATGDPKAAYVQLMRQQLRLQEELAVIDARLRNQLDEAWLDRAFPLRVRSPLMGRCYLQLRPDAAPFVQLGDHVTPSTVVCLVEAMKVFYEITAGCHGFVSEVAVASGVPVECNQVLFRISRPSLDFW